MNLDVLRRRFGSTIMNVNIFRNETTLTVRHEEILPMARFLRDHETCAFAMLTDLCGLDLSPASPRFAIVYHLSSPALNQRLRIKVLLEGENPAVDSVVSIWEAADWHERECYDLLGIRFTNHPDLRRILTPDDFRGHALRKDYPLEGMQP